MRFTRGVSGLLCLTIILVFSAGSVLAGVVYVNQNGGNDTYTGQSWSQAKATIQAGVDATAPGDEVWVAKGIYVENIVISKSVHLYGGFTGVESARQDRDYSSNNTTIDGDYSGSVVEFDNVGASCTLDGFTIRNGEAYNGGGICVSSGSPTIENNTIVANSAPHKGGGVFLDSGAGGVLANNLIHGNTSLVGGGVFLEAFATMQIINNTVVHNSSADAIRSDSLLSSLLANNIIAFNTSCGIRGNSNLILQNNCVYNPDGVNYSNLSPGATDIQADPKFESLEYGQLHIQPDSPCVDAGDDSAVGPGWTDMDGEARVQGAHVDIGVDESNGTVWSFTPSVVYVKPGGNDANDGSSWSQAKATVQSALFAAQSQSAQVWVADGIYYENLELLPYSRLYGGFTATETSLSERDYSAHATILDGLSSGSVITTSSGFAPTLVDGFTIRNASVVSDGAVSANKATIYLTHNVIGPNAADRGVSLTDCNATLISNLIIDNSGTNTSYQVYCSKGESTIVNNTIVEGDVGIYCDDDTIPLIVNNVFFYLDTGLEYSTYTYDNTTTKNCFTNGYVGVPCVGGELYKDNYYFEPFDIWEQDTYPELPCNSPAIDVGYMDDPRIDLDLLSDCNGNPRVYGGVVDLGAYEYTQTSINGLKALPDGAVVDLEEVCVTYYEDDFLYVENRDRSSGIRVVKTDHNILGSGLARVQGVMATNANDERYIDASVTELLHADSLLWPLFVTGRNLGGGDNMYDPVAGTGQRGVTGASGLNNIGLRVTIAGEFGYLNSTSFTVTDGSGIPVKCVVPSTITLDPEWGFVRVTGISSCELDGSDLKSVVLISVHNDIDSY